MELQRLCISYAGRRNSGTWELYQRENQSSLSLSVPDESKREDLLKKGREGERDRESDEWGEASDLMRPELRMSGTGIDQQC